METEDGEQPIGMMVGLAVLLLVIVLAVVGSVLFWVFTGSVPTFGLLGKALAPRPAGGADGHEAAYCVVRIASGGDAAVLPGALFAFLAAGACNGRGGCS
jgi:hypothetical protein